MAEYNAPNPLNYGIASGVTAFIEEQTSVGVYSDIICLGNILSAPITMSTEKFKHYSNLFGMDAKDREITIKREVKVVVEFDELVKDGLRYLLQASTRTASVSINVPKVERVTFATNTAQVNGGNAITSIAWVKPTTGDTEYDEGATGDYTLTEATGTLTRTAGSSIGATDEVVVCYYIAKTANRYNTMTDTDIRGKLHIVGVGTKDAGAVVGQGFYVYFPLVEIDPEGDINFLSKTEPRKAQLGFEVLEDPNFGYVYSW